jgi:phenylalanyl-tRNA synthetase beta chain
MLFSYNWLQSFFKKKLPKPKKLAELLTMHSFEVKEVKKFKNDWVLDIDVLPNRPDCFSHLGIALECAVLTKSKIKYQKSKITEDKKIKTKDLIKIEVKDEEACPRYTARVITDVKIGESPDWIKNRLKACGLRPISNVVDIANYAMLETGQPLHAFDLDKIEGPEGKQASNGAGRKIVVRLAKKGEKIVTLDNQKFELDKNILVIADEKDPLAIAGIKGGKKAEIDKKTKNILIESANFNPIVIRQASRKLNLKTDASLRFEHGLDPNLTELAIEKIAELVLKIAKGKAAKDLIDFYPKKIFERRIKLELGYIEKLLGLKISIKEIKNILEGLNFKTFLAEPGKIIVEVPTSRLDISLPEDLVEEIGRIFGYQKIPEVIPLATLIPPERNLDVFWEGMAKNILKEAGFTEVYNYSFISEREAKIFNYKKRDLSEIENPTSFDFQYLRPSLIPNLLKNVQKNQSNFKEIKIFELGKVFIPLEKNMLTGLMTGDAFYQVKGVCDFLLNKLGISNVWYDEYKATPEETKISIWSPKTAEIKINHEEIGFLGEISSKILENFKISQKVILFDINFEKLQKYCSEEHEYRPISRYPAAVRDIAVLVPIKVRTEDVLNKIEATSPLIRDVDLFDIYEGEEIPEGKMNLAFHIIFQAADRTLSSGEIDQIQKKIIKALEENPEWQVRK